MDENNKKSGKRVIKVERDSFSFSGEFEKEHGKFVLKTNFVVKTNNIKAGQVKEFTLDDIELIKPSELSLDNLPTFEKELIKKGYVPLDVYCANALFETIKKSYLSACTLSPSLPFTNIVFLGSTMNTKDGLNSEINCYAFFEYNCLGMYRQIPELVFSQSNPGMLNSEYVAAVFKKSFFNEEDPAKNNNLENQDYDVAAAFFRFQGDELAENKNLKKEPGKMPTLEQCQTKTIKLLQERLKQVTKERDELKVKYENASLITKPQLNTETIELLCKRVCDFNLSTRVINATDTDNVIYLFQLVSMSKAQLGRMRNIYKKSIKEISDFIEGLGLSLETKLSQEEHNYFWKIIEEKLATK